MSKHAEIVAPMQEASLAEIIPPDKETEIPRIKGKTFTTDITLAQRAKPWLGPTQ